MIASAPGVSSARPDPLQHPQGDELAGGLGQRAQRRGEREPADAHEVDPPAAPAVAEAPADEDEGGEREQVPVDDPLQLGEGRVRGPRRCCAARR